MPRTPTFIGSVGTFRAGGTGAVDGTLLSVFNKTGSGVLVALRRLTVQMDQTSAVTVIRTVEVSRLTTAPTDGTLHEPQAWDTTQTHNANVEIRGRASADGTNGTLTATPTTANPLRYVFVQKPITAVGQMLAPDRELLFDYPYPEDPLILREGEGVLVSVQEVDSGFINYLINVMIEEFTYSGGAIVRTWTSAVTQADAWTRSLTLTRTHTDATTQADVWTRTLTLGRTWADATTQADAWVRVLTAVRPWTSTAMQADVWTRTVTLGRTTTEAVTSSDVWTRTVTLLRTWTSATVQADAWTQTKILARSWTSAVTQADVWTRAVTLARTLTEAVTQADVWTRVVTLGRTLTEAVAQADSWVAVKLGAIVRSWSDAVTQADVWTRVSTVARTWADAATQADAWTQAKSTARTWTSTVTQADAWTRALTLVRELTTTITHSDAWTRSGTFLRALTSTVTQLDAWTSTVIALVGTGFVAVIRGVRDVVLRAVTGDAPSSGRTGEVSGRATSRDVAITGTSDDEVS